MKFLKSILLYIWQLPQNLLGLILLGFYWLIGGKPKHYLTIDNVKYYWTLKMSSGISLGKYVILKYHYNRKANAVKHEFGHSLQSKRWGWLYLIVIGIPSLCGNIIDRVFHKNWDDKKATIWYYNQPVEKQADELGGVVR